MLSFHLECPSLTSHWTHTIPSINSSGITITSKTPRTPYWGLGVFFLLSYIILEFTLTKIYTTDSNCPFMDLFMDPFMDQGLGCHLSLDPQHLEYSRPSVNVSKWSSVFRTEFNFFFFKSISSHLYSLWIIPLFIHPINHAENSVIFTSFLFLSTFKHSAHLVG